MCAGFFRMADPASGTTSGSHPPIITRASIVSDTSTSMVSKEASFIMASASYPDA
jgi:hypothetical protein